MSRLIRPLRAGDEFLADVRAATGPLDLWWLGQSGFLLAWQGRHLLLDPYLSDSLTRKYAGTDKPHVRMTERVVDPARLGFVDAVAASHAHTDHLDPDTLRGLPQAELVAPAAHRDLATERSGRAPVGIDDGETVEVAGFTITAVPAAHEEIERDAAGRMPTSATWSAAGRSRCTTRATPCGTTGWRSACARRAGQVASTSRCCRSTAGRRNGGWRET